MTKQWQREVEGVFNTFYVSADVLWIHGFRLICLSPVAEPSAARQGASGFGTELQLKAFHWCQTGNQILTGKGKKVMDGTFS